ncbi:MAG: hypothetical protein N2652_07120 [Kiritimatiellae bacterium]|nr:hypothetical protein [Kiritimatiellia bacterium]
MALAVGGGASGATLALEWTNNWLTIRGGALPPEGLRVHYLEAVCRANSRDADWVTHTLIPHRTEWLRGAPDRTELELITYVEDGLQMHHRIVARADEVEFQVEASHAGRERSVAHWAQVCPRLGRFTGFDDRGPDPNDYLTNCFLVLDGELTRMPTREWAVSARYTPGQVWCPRGVPPEDVNPRPLNPRTPSLGLIGCFSADGRWMWATAWEPYQELFQGVARCLHADFRLGGLRRGQRRRIRGKMYIVRADPAALLRRYLADFPEHAESTR